MDEPKPEWKYKTELGVNKQMKEVIQATLDVTKAEIERLRRKVEKLTYGS